MGHGSQELRIVTRLVAEGYINRGAKIVEIGAQQLSNDFLRHQQEVDELGRLLGVQTPSSLPAPGREERQAGQLETLQPDAPSAKAFWEWLGFQYAMIDLEADGRIPLDLNFDKVPGRYRGHFDLVTNIGTTEHVANQLNAFKVIHDLTKLGGTMLHRVPSQGHLSHGLINYNLKFFWMLARSNGYKWLFMNFEAYPEFAYKVPDEILSSVRPFSHDAGAQLETYRPVDCTATVALQKIVDIAFVPPIDVPTGTATNDKVMRRRYWTIFDPQRLEKAVIAQIRAAAAANTTSTRSVFANTLTTLARLFPGTARGVKRLVRGPLRRVWTLTTNREPHSTPGVKNEK
jgi:hypothetical protein